MNVCFSPRIAANSQYVSNVLGLKNSVHKQKLALKAMDAVLFGAPKCECRCSVKKCFAKNYKNTNASHFLFTIYNQHQAEDKIAL